MNWFLYNRGFRHKSHAVSALYREHSVYKIVDLNPVVTNVLMLYPQKTLENQRFFECILEQLP